MKKLLTTLALTLSSILLLNSCALINGQPPPQSQQSGSLGELLEEYFETNFYTLRITSFYGDDFPRPQERADTESFDGGRFIIDPLVLDTIFSHIKNLQVTLLAADPLRTDPNIYGALRLSFEDALPRFTHFNPEADFAPPEKWLSIVILPTPQVIYFISSDSFFRIDDTLYILSYENLDFDAFYELIRANHMSIYQIITQIIAEYLNDAP